jgi:hypothetical protein
MFEAPDLLINIGRRQHILDDVELAVLLNSRLADSNTAGNSDAG